MVSELPEGPLVEVNWLKNHLNDPEIIIVDCRYNLFDHQLGSREYSEGHVPGAYFLHMEKQLTGAVAEHGGRHPIPDVEVFKDSMNGIGLNENKTVIAYDNDGSGASRLWWLLTYFGHPNVKILNGGFPLWVEQDLPVSKDVPGKRTGTFTPNVDHSLLTSQAEISSMKNKGTLIDSRARERYLGNVEPIDFKAGHIPGAINIPYTDAIRDKATFLPKEELKELYKGVSENPVVYCGSGITSCVNFVALRSIGRNPRLYAGGWSDWITYKNNEVATGDQL